MIPIPWYTDLETWAGELALVLEKVDGVVPRLAGAATWQGWATSLGLLPALAGRPLPEPTSYADWRIWADDFVQAAGIEEAAT